jgi:hypothetical protein
MLFDEWKINFFSKNVNDFEKSINIKNIIELIKSFKAEIVPAFKLRNENPQNIFDNIIGKYVSFIMLIKGLKPKNFEYNSYWLENEEFMKLISENNIILKEIEPIYVDYFFKNGNEKHSNQYHTDSNHIDGNDTILTSLIYLTDNMIPTLILDADNKSIGLCFPEYSKTVIFDGGKNIHGYYKELYNDKEPRIYIALNVYSVPDKYTPHLDINMLYHWYYMYNHSYPKELPIDLDITIDKNKSNTIVDVEINSTKEEFELFKESLKKNNTEDSTYKKYKFRILSEINKYIKNDMKRAFNIKINTNIYDWVMFDTNDTNDHDVSETKFDPYNKKYYNVFCEKSIFSNETCEWLITEANNQVKEIYGEWKNDRHNMYPTYDISIDKLKPPVMNYILNYFMRKIGLLVYNRFNISKEMDLSIKEAFIVKYEENKQRFLEFHTDDSDITAIILLSNENSFTGGGTQFETGLCVYPNQGDMLLFGSQFKHQGMEIKTGVRMILTLFIDVLLK